MIVAGYVDEPGCGADTDSAEFFDLVQLWKTRPVPGCCSILDLAGTIPTLRRNSLRFEPASSHRQRPCLRNRFHIALCLALERYDDAEKYDTIERIGHVNRMEDDQDYDQGFDHDYDHDRGHQPSE